VVDAAAGHRSAVAELSAVVTGVAMLLTGRAGRQLAGRPGSAVNPVQAYSGSRARSTVLVVRRRCPALSRASLIKAVDHACD
jgi:hypothetical protein